MQTFDPAENIHENGILAYSIVPARLSADVQQQARQMAQRLADELDYVGVLAVEMFVVGDTHELVVNEIARARTIPATIRWMPAPQTSSSSRYALCAICRPPIPSCFLHVAWRIFWATSGRKTAANRIGCRCKAIRMHTCTYTAKKAARKGRKMGHFTVLSADADAALQQSQKLRSLL